MRVGTALALCCLVAGAQDQNERAIASLEQAIGRGGIAAVAAHLRVDIISSRAEWARRICTAAVGCDIRHAVRMKEELRDAADRIHEIGRRARDRFEADADALQACADGAYFKARVLQALGDETPTELWLEMADALARLAAVPGTEGAPHLRQAIRRLREGRRADGVDADALRAREKELSATGREAFPDEDVFHEDTLNAELDSIEALVAEHDYKEAKARLEAFLEKAKDDTIYNDAVNLARSEKRLYLKPDFRTRRITLADTFAAEVPRGERWEAERGGSDIGEIRQYDRAGELVREFAIDYFKRNTWYVLGDTKYDGVNVKGMALITERDVLSVVLKVDRRTRIVKRRLNRHIGLAQTFEIGGLSEDGFVRFRSYLWRGEERDWLTYRLWIIERRDFEDLDPAAQHVLDSLEELE